MPILSPLIPRLLPQPFAATAPCAVDLLMGSATSALRLFAAQAGVVVVFAPTPPRTARTTVVRGDIAPADTPERMLRSTSRVAERSPRAGAFTALRRAPALAR